MYLCINYFILSSRSTTGNRAMTTAANHKAKASL